MVRGSEIGMGREVEEEEVEEEEEDDDIGAEKS